MRPVAARKRTSTELSRLGSLNAIHEAFEIIGGTNRLALWANANPEKFYPLWARATMPATSVNVHGDNARVEIVHSLPATDLDQHRE